MNCALCSYQHPATPAGRYQPYSRDTAGFREIASSEQEKEEEEVEEAGSPDYGDPSLVGLNFYREYGQHDDRPLVVREKEESKEAGQSQEQRRPGEIRFGGMSFALPPPGAFPDIPSREYGGGVEDYEDYQEEFNQAKLREQPRLPGISVVNSAGRAPGFDSFHRQEEEGEKYLENPFGDDFIKLEIDRDRFDTNKTKPGVHHIPHDVFGYPEVPPYKVEEDADFGPRLPLDPVKVKRKTRKPLYRPPPVLTKYTPPASLQEPEFRTENIEKQTR